MKNAAAFLKRRDVETRVVGTLNEGMEVVATSGLDDPDQAKFQIGTQGAAAIYTGGGGFAALRRIGIRSYTWLNWLYPIPF